MKIKSTYVIVLILTAGSAILAGCGDKKVSNEGQGKPLVRATADDPSAGSLANPKPIGGGGK